MEVVRIPPPTSGKFVRHFAGKRKSDGGAGSVGGSVICGLCVVFGMPRDPPVPPPYPQPLDEGATVR